MNRLLNKNKKKEEVNTIECPPSRDTSTPGPSQQQAKKRWGRKKLEPEPKPELVIPLTLPTSDNFRTSLIMPNLSARFSMLREQDDPHSLLGKASDDSVLTSNRRSRLADFNGTGLTDIAEVSSIRSIPRPPFAAESRTQSYQTDGYGTDDDSSYNGSIMSRARPGEGNVLFGGRQKIYKIPIGDAGSVKNLGSNESRGMRGRALYEDDVHMSAFQKMKERERQAERERRLAELEREMQLDEAGVPILNSPSLSTYDEKRETTSSTNSGPSMMSGSTTATSVASQGPYSAPGASPLFMPPQHQPPGLQISNSRRLYEQGLDQHMSDQQNAALTRLNSMQRKSSAGGRSGLHQTRSASNLNERYDKGSSASSRAPSPMSPPAEKLTTFDSLGDAQKQSNAPPTFVANGGDDENPLTQALQPNDRGKATALGSFSRPKQFDEAQFLARQRSLHQQRSESRNRRPAGSPIRVESRRPSAEGRYGYHPRPSFEQRSRAGTGHSDYTRPSMEESSRAGTSQSDRSFSVGSGTNTPHPEAANVESPTLGGLAEAGDSDSSHQVPSRQASATFFDSPRTDDDVESSLRPGQHKHNHSPSKISFERGSVADLPLPLRSPPPPIHDHPAMRGEAPTSPSIDKRKGWSPDTPIGNFVPPESILHPSHDLPSIDIDGQSAPEIAFNSHRKGLSTVREHLRQASNVSSVYPDDVEEKRHSAAMQDFNMEIPSMYSQQANSWDADTFTPPPQHALPAPKVVQNPGVPLPLRTSDDRMDTAPGPQEVRASDAASWIQDLHTKHHARGGSTETEHERKEFAEDLRLRKQAIQENLKHKNENGSRPPSPSMSNGPFGMLRTRTSRESMTGKDHSSKGGRINGHAMNGNPSHFPQDRSVSSPALRGRHGGPPPAMGRTLHSRMPERKYIQASPPESSRTSTSRDEFGSGRSSEQFGRSRQPSNASSDVQRRDITTQVSSGRPSIDTNRAQGYSNNTHARPTMPPLRMTNTAPGRPMPSTNDVSPMSNPTSPIPRVHSANNTPPLSATSFRPAIPADLRGQTNTSLSQTNFANQPLSTPQTLPSSTYTFPSRTPAERPSATTGRRNGRSATINKADISEPTLISSTSNFETVDLAEKRARLAREAAMTTNSAPTSPPLSPPPIPSVNPRRGFFQRGSKTDSQARNSAASDEPNMMRKNSGHDEDEFMTRPSGGRYRIRKVSSDLGSRRRHEAVTAGLVEGGEGERGSLKMM